MSTTRSYYPDIDIHNVVPEVSQVNDDVRDGLNKCSGNNVDRPVNRVPGSKAFYCLRPLSKDQIGNLKLDGENVVGCPTHCPQKNLADCLYCHARQQQLVERAELICKVAEGGSKIRGVQKVFTPLAFCEANPHGIVEISRFQGRRERVDGT